MHRDMMDGNDEHERASLLGTGRSPPPSVSPPASESDGISDGAGMHPRGPNAALAAGASAASATTTAVSSSSNVVPPVVSSAAPSILLPTSLLALEASSSSPLSSPVLSPDGQHVVGGGGASGSLLFASSQLLDPSLSPPLHPSSAASSTVPRSGPSGAGGSWLDALLDWISPNSPSEGRYSSVPLQPIPSALGLLRASRSTDDVRARERDASSPDGACSITSLKVLSSSPFSSDSDPYDSLPHDPYLPCLRFTTLLTALFFLLFLLVFAGESYVQSVERSDRMQLLSLPPEVASRLTLNASSLISWSEARLTRTKDLNRQLRAGVEREETIQSLRMALANRDEVLHSYKKVVARLKALQVEHEETERRVAEAASGAHALLMPGGALHSGSSGGGGGGGGSGSAAVDLSRYKQQLLYLLFGNKTLDQSRVEHERAMRAAAEEHRVLELLRAEHEKAAVGVEALFRSSAAPEVKLESVVRVQEGGEDEMHGGGGADGEGGSKSSAGPADKLVDSEKNEYILSKPGDATSHSSVDARLILDLGIVIVASALGGLLASLAKQPILLGYLVGGMFIGPGGCKAVGQVIQIETLAQFGATFLLFALGVEFSIAKLRRVKHVALFGGGLQLGCIMLVVCVLGVWLLDLRTATAAFVGAVLAMSSTTVVVKSLMERRQIASLGGQVMLGLLIVQDLFLSFMLALLNLARVPLERLAQESLWLGLRFALLALIVVGCMYLWPACLRALDASKSHDLFLLGLVALCVLLTVVSERIIHSAEVGAFLSGILISSSPNASAELTHRSLRLFGPIRDMFGALFFCSIGMLINPFFLIEKAPTIALLVVATILLKSIITLVIVRVFGYSLEIALRAGLGLAQVGEFAFVMLSQGLSVGMLSKDLYFLLLGTTAVSIFITPFILTLSNSLVKRFGLEDEKVHALGATVD